MNKLLRHPKAARRLSHLLVLLLIYGLVLLVETFFLSPMLANPNAHVFAFGGDAFIIHFNMIYHVCHGQGWTLAGMNYPWYEWIFMTDAQASLTLLLSWIHRHITPLCDYVIGISNGLIFYTIPLTAIFYYLIFRKWKLPIWYAVVMAILICFLSPQWPRVKGHFGLAYLFVIPMCLWWYLDWWERKTVRARDGLVLAALLFFTFNNPYLGFISCGLIAGTALVEGISRQGLRFYKNGFWWPQLVGILPLIALFVMLKTFDPISDRVGVQWGFFEYYSRWTGLFRPPGSWMNEWLNTSWPLESYTDEGICYIGFMPLMILMAGIVVVLGRARYGRYLSWTMPTALRSLIIASLLMLLIAMPATFYGALREEVEMYTPSLLMFKASGRFAWAFFHVFQAWVVLYFWRLLKQSDRTFGRIWASTLAIVAISIWAWDDFRFLKHHLDKPLYENPYRINKLRYLRHILKENDIRAETYQAIYVVPIMQGWTDKMIAKLQFDAHYQGLRLSAATGLPLISAMLSRMSVSQTLMATQMASDPRMAKELFDHLPNQKDILLVRGGQSPRLTPGERALIEASDTLYVADRFALFRLRFDDADLLRVQANARTMFDSMTRIDSIGPYYTDTTFAFLHESFDGNESDIAFHGSGAALAKKTESIFWESDVRSLDLSIPYEWSIWTHVDSEKYGLPKWYISAFDGDGREIWRRHVSTRESKEVHESWVRSSLVLPINPTADRMLIEVEANQAFVVDEMWLKPVSSHISYSLDTVRKKILIDNYPLRAVPE